jgi:hypothetical protein
MKAYFFSLLLVLPCTLSAAITIRASAFNAIYSSLNPYTATQTINIILDVDIVINTPGMVAQPIQTGAGFNLATDSINFSSTTGNKVLVTQSTAWKYGFNMQFTGNASLVTQRGATLWANNATITMNGTTFSQTDPS